MTDLQVEKIIKMLQESSYTNYYIAKKTGLSNSTLKNYKEKKTKPTNVNVQILEQFFENENSKNTTNSSKNIIADKISNSNINQITNEKLMNDQLLECQKLVDYLKEQIKTKDETIKLLIESKK